MEKYDEFVKLYNNPEIKKTRIHKILGWSTRQYNKARQHAILEGDITPFKDQVKYYHWSSVKKRFIVSRKKGNTTIYVTCNTEEEAIELVNYLKNKGWTRKNVARFQEKWNNECADRQP